MNLDNPIQSLAQALAHAQYEGFPEYEYQDRDWEHYHKTKEDKRITKRSRHSPRDLIVHAMFPQTWSSTALGFGGVGGQAMTPAYTVIIESDYCLGFCVYFNGRFAYRIEKPNDHFFGDNIHQQKREVAGAIIHYER
jgi:hypothetical protein